MSESKKSLGGLPAVLLANGPSGALFADLSSLLLGPKHQSELTPFLAPDCDPELVDCDPE